MTQVGCETKDGLIIVHPEDTTCEVCAPDSVQGEVPKKFWNAPRILEILNNPDQTTILENGKAIKNSGNYRLNSPMKTGHFKSFVCVNYFRLRCRMYLTPLRQLCTMST
jgi:hypothetical protein